MEPTRGVPEESGSYGVPPADRDPGEEESDSRAVASLAKQQFSQQLRELVQVNQVLRRVQGEAPATEPPSKAIQEAFVARMWQLAQRGAPADAVEQALNSLPLAPSASDIAEAIGKITPPDSFADKTQARLARLPAPMPWRRIAIAAGSVGVLLAILVVVWQFILPRLSDRPLHRSSR